ncbi:MAG TPA: histidine kinase, partial [Halomonas sp.]
MRTRLEAIDIFRQLAEGMGQSGTPHFYAALVERLAAIMGVEHVLVAAIAEQGAAKTLAVWSNGAPQDNFTYSLAGTPCETV